MNINKFQRLSQLISLLLYNPYFAGFLSGMIYRGKLKHIPCVGFNCHSCPAAVFACPVGAIQLFVSYGTYYISIYLIGFLSLIGAVGGRIVCGWACPFGLIQDLLHKVPSPKWKFPDYLCKARYLIFLLLIIIIPFLTGEPWFCKLCPAGTLEAGIPLILLDKDLAGLTNGFFYLKISILILFIFWMIASKRPFCRTICPLGLIYSFFNKISILKLKLDPEKCTNCSTCGDECPVSINIHETGPNSSECIRCLRCTKCPEGAVKVGWK
jgi:ferredoxin-type protein NapH